MVFIERPDNRLQLELFFKALGLLGGSDEEREIEMVHDNFTSEETREDRASEVPYGRLIRPKEFVGQRISIPVAPKNSTGIFAAGKVMVFGCQ